jgi:alkanesulfonate monooxygenase SsuD/methylene tetrahydromethanopterin reductase-like flavin-dependent oxidoreductase (luciferase family)
MEVAVPGTLRFAISIPQFVADGAFDPGGLRTYLARATGLGFDSAWTLEQVLGTTPVLGPIETMTYAAACSEDLRLGCAVFVTPLYSPVHLAKSLSTLDQLSRGRVEVGVATGGRARPFAAFAVDPASLVSRFTEGLRLMKALWTEPEVNFQGRFWQLEGAAMTPRPFQKPHPPIWFGANHPAALARAVAHGDGFFGAGSTATDQFAQQVPIVREALSSSGRDSAGFGFAKRVYIAVDDDADRARRRIAGALIDLYGDFGRHLEPAAVAGDVAGCIEGVQRVADAGAELILFTPLFDEPEQMERLAAEVMPNISRSG